MSLPVDPQGGGAAEGHRPRRADAERLWCGSFEGEEYRTRPEAALARLPACRAERFTSPGLIRYIRDGLERHGATAKVIPPHDVIEPTVRDERHAQVAAEVTG
jgi:hypothetical protein